MVVIVRKAKRENGVNKPVNEKYYSKGKWVNDIEKADKFTRYEALDLLSQLSDKYFYTFLYVDGNEDEKNKNGNGEENSADNIDYEDGTVVEGEKVNGE